MADMKQNRDCGMGLLLAIVLLTVVAASIGLLAPAVYQVTAADNTSKISDDLDLLKIALAGNPRLIIGGGRSDFGYIGSMGNVPAGLSALWLKGSQKDYFFDTVRKVGAGWVGPYVPGTFVTDLLAMDKDRFGNDLEYTLSPDASTAIRIRSAGMDGVQGTADDQTVNILNAEVFSTVTGTLKKGNNPIKFASVTLNVPVDGDVEQVFSTTNSSGVFTFTNVSFGFRSITVDPKLTYEEGSATTPNNTLKFTVTNYGTDDLTISSITPVYPYFDPPTNTITAYYEKIRIGNTNVWNYTTDGTPAGTRAGSGQTKSFSAVTVKGSGKPNQAVPIRVEKQTTTTPDVLIKGVGKSVVIQLQDFKQAATGSASNANVPTGILFTITFGPDGSEAEITTP